MQIDSFLTKGTAHPICEDYIRHGSVPHPYVILSDGCSSSKNTDIGARILVSQVYKMIINGHEAKPTTTLLSESLEIVEKLGLSPRCLDATLIWAYLTDEGVEIKMLGDGNIIAIDKDDSVYLYNISYEENAPYYLSYLKDTRDMAEYFEKFSENKVQRTYVDNKLYSLEETPVVNPSSFCFSPEDNKAVLITSDGIESFIGGAGENLAEVVKEFTAFKNTKGEFVKRRAQKAIKKLGTHYDDISIGGFFF